MRITDRLRQCKQQGRKALSFFITAGYPTIESTVPIVTALAKSRADLVEIGIPFSDPIADGPTIQMSSEQALRNGITLTKTLTMAKEIRTQTDIPLVLMGYANPIFAFGLQKFIQTSAEYGIDGVIIPDLPLEESREYQDHTAKSGIASIFLASPTTSDERLRRLDQASTGFLYCVSVAGVTGVRTDIAEQAKTFLRRAQKHIRRNPMLVGFGISTPNDAKEISTLCDGVIIGSALIKILQTAPKNRIIEEAQNFVASFANVLNHNADQSKI